MIVRQRKRHPLQSPFKGMFNGLPLKLMLPGIVVTVVTAAVVASLHWCQPGMLEIGRIDVSGSNTKHFRGDLLWSALMCFVVFIFATWSHRG
jgi:hypothetical protein